MDTVDGASDSGSLVINEPAQDESPVSAELMASASTSSANAVGVARQIPLEASVTPVDSSESSTSEADGEGGTPLDRQGKRCRISMSRSGTSGRETSRAPDLRKVC